MNRLLVLLCVPLLFAASDESSLLGLKRGATLAGHEGQVSQVKFLPGRKPRLVSTGYDDKTVRLWNPVSGELLATLSLRFGPRDFIVGPEGKRVEVLLNTGGLSTIPIEGDSFGTPKSHWGRAGGHGRIARSPDSNFYAIASRDEDVTVWDALRRQIHQSYRGTLDYSAVAFSPEPGVFAAANNDHGFAIWDIFDLQGFGARRDYDIEGATPGLGTWAMSFNNAGSALATSHADGSVTLWSLPQPGINARQANHFRLPESAFALRFSADDKLLFINCQDGNIYVWHTQLEQLVKAFKGDRGSLISLAINDPSNIMVAGSLAGEIVTWRRGQ